MKSMYNALTTMYQHAYKNMSAKDLGQVESALHGSAVCIAQDASALFEGIACLVSSENDAHEAGMQVSGSLQNSGGIFHLCCAAAHKFDLLAALIEVSGEAAAEMENRKEAAK